MKCLSPCTNNTNCVFVEWYFKNVHLAFSNLTEITLKLPRITILTTSNIYLHVIVRSLIFRFPDDLEVLKLPQKKLIQVRSSSRLGVSDLGVNKARIDSLYRHLIKLQQD